jgi:hypothetical protein
MVEASGSDPAGPSIPARRKRKWLPVLLALLAGAALVCNAQNPSPLPRNKGWKLVWSDEFSAPNGSPVDRSKWVLETGVVGPYDFHRGSGRP